MGEMSAARPGRTPLTPTYWSSHDRLKLPQTAEAWGLVGGRFCLALGFRVLNIHSQEQELTEGLVPGPLCVGIESLGSLGTLSQWAPEGGQNGSMFCGITKTVTRKKVKCLLKLDSDSHE